MRSLDFTQANKHVAYQPTNKPTNQTTSKHTKKKKNKKKKKQMKYLEQS